MIRVTPNAKQTKQQKLASKSYEKIQKILSMGNMVDPKDDSIDITIKIGESQDALAIPKQVFDLLMENLLDVAKGDEEISTQQAADILNVSRPYVVKLLEEEKIPHRKVGVRRKILLRDIKMYEQNMRAKRKEGLDYLAEQAQELNMGY